MPAPPGEGSPAWPRAWEKVGRAGTTHVRDRKVCVCVCVFVRVCKGRIEDCRHGRRNRAVRRRASVSRPPPPQAWGILCKRGGVPSTAAQQDRHQGCDPGHPEAGLPSVGRISKFQVPKLQTYFLFPLNFGVMGGKRKWRAREEAWVRPVKGIDAGDYSPPPEKKKQQQNKVAFAKTDAGATPMVTPPCFTRSPPWIVDLGEAPPPTDSLVLISQGAGGA